MLHQIYLAGPGVFFKDVDEHFARLKALCAKHGLEGVSPLDAAIPAMHNPAEHAAAIRAANEGLIRRCTAVLADVAPFRGAVEPDSGTCYEIGFARALGKPVALYGVCETLLARVEGACGPLIAQDSGRREAATGLLVEDFGLGVNLMLAGALYVGPAADEALKHLSAHLALRSVADRADLRGVGVRGAGRGLAP